MDGTHAQSANQTFDQFAALYEAQYSAAIACLTKEHQVLLAFYHFPGEHWLHLRTTNPIESTFATLRLRHRRPTGNDSRLACLPMVFKPCEPAISRGRLLNGVTLLPEVIAAVQLSKGEMTVTCAG